VIKLKDFQKIELRVARVLEAQNIENTQKLIRLKVDLGDEQRQLIAGLRPAYQDKDLIGKQVIVLVNLEPRPILGNLSQGMLLAAIDKNGNPVLISPERSVDSGAQVK